jgi:hypothetical protein
VILSVEAWIDLRRYQPLREAGTTWREVADEVGLNWRTVKCYLSTDAPFGPPSARSRCRCVTRKIDALALVADACWPLEGSKTEIHNDLCAASTKTQLLLK